MGICKCEEGKCSVHVYRKSAVETKYKKIKKTKNIPEFEIKNPCECDNCDCDDHGICDCEDCECIECSC